MSDAERIKAARARLGWSQKQLADKVNISQPAIKKIESGETTKSRFLPDVLRALNLDPQPRPPGGPLNFTPAPPPLVGTANPVKVYASAEGGGGALIISTDIVEMAPRPYTLENVDDAYGIVIEGESMTPAFEPGDIAWVNPRARARRGYDAILYRVNDETGESRAMIKRVISFTETEWTLRQYNPPKDFKLPRAEWTFDHRVVGKLSRR